jgi:hypothetical protein
MSISEVNNVPEMFTSKKDIQYDCWLFFYP